jgi:phosphoenolpyruvate synthase/pyruvate phosphate dikinase
VSFILLLRNVERADLESVGGKAASLGELLHSGFPVPDGFVLATEAFRANATALQPDFEAEVLRTFDGLATPQVAVRSSAVAEDAKDASWAGQLDTFLNVTRDKLIQSIQKCWASGTSPRAVAYAAQHGSAADVAVVVQRMIASDVSGVAFSVHPVTQNYNQIVIEAALGLGEAAVSGRVTPDTYLVAKNKDALSEKYVATQREQLVGNRWRNVGEAGARQKLSDRQISELASIVIEIERHYGFPVDVEWAFAGGQFFITQSRPITTLA